MGSYISGITEKLILTSIGLRSLSIQFDLTNACNLACSHCYHPHHSNKGGIALDSWKSILDQYQDLLGLLKAQPNIAICGGEPLASPHLYPFMDMVVDRWPRAFLGVMTNGTLIEKHIERLKKYPLFFQVSLEAPTESEHDQIRGTGSFRRALSGIELLKSAGFAVHVLVILSKRTAKQIDQMFALAKQLGLNSLNFTRAIPSGAGALYFNTNSDAPLEGYELRDALVEIVASSRKFGVPTNTDKPLFSLIDESLGRSGAAGFQGLVIDYKGQLKASSRAELVLGNVLTEGLANLYFNHPILRQLRNGRVSGCEGCRHLNRCGGDRSYALATTGDFLGADRGCWILNEPKSNHKK